MCNQKTHKLFFGLLLAFSMESKSQTSSVVSTSTKGIVPHSSAVYLEVVELLVGKINRASQNRELINGHVVVVSSEQQKAGLPPEVVMVQARSNTIAAGFEKSCGRISSIDNHFIWTVSNKTEIKLHFFCKEEFEGKVIASSRRAHEFVLKITDDNRKSLDLSESIEISDLISVSASDSFSQSAEISTEKIS